MVYAHWVNDANPSNLNDIKKITNSVDLTADKLIEVSNSDGVLDTCKKILKRLWQYLCSAH